MTGFPKPKSVVSPREGDATACNLVDREAIVDAPFRISGKSIGDVQKHGVESLTLEQLHARGQRRRSEVLHAFDVIGDDGRVRVDDTTLYPWAMVCSLKIERHEGEPFWGTGWLAGPSTVITAGHCIWNSEIPGWAKAITVMPGRSGSNTPFGSLQSDRFSLTDHWYNYYLPDFDYGCIHLPEPVGEDIGWFSTGALPDSLLHGKTILIPGYPTDEADGQYMYYDQNRISALSSQRLFYEVDTMIGQSGAPVWKYDDNGLPEVVGLHAYGIEGTPPGAGIVANSGPRINRDFAELIQEWISSNPYP